MKNWHRAFNSPSTFVKICGLTDEEMVDIAVGSGANAIGFVFVEDSPRCLDRERASQLMLQLPNDVIGVAVLQNEESLEDFSTWDGWLQLCGDEDEEMVSMAPCPVIKSIQWDKEEVMRWDGCENIVAILVDGSTGGLGKTFDLQELIELIPSLNTPVIIAGGLTPENIQDVITQANPAGVDTSSGVESAKGVKDPEKICSFLEQVRAIG
jgi:phosphoribosylanthranilate isomerase